MLCYFCTSFCWRFCAFFKIFYVCLGKNTNMLIFTRVYVCVKAKLTLVSCFWIFLHLVFELFEFTQIFSSEEALYVMMTFLIFWAFMPISIDFLVDCLWHEMSNGMQCQMKWNVKWHEMSNVKCHKMSNVMKCTMSNVVKCQMSWNVKCHEVGRIGRICQFGRIGRTSLRQPPDIPQTPPNTLQTPTRQPTDTFLKPQTPSSPDTHQKPSRHTPNNLQTTPKTPATIIFGHIWS